MLTSRAHSLVIPAHGRSYAAVVSLSAFEPAELVYMHRESLNGSRDHIAGVGPC